MAMNAHPAPIDPYSPIPASTTTSNTEDTIRHPSPFIPIRLPIFAIVIWLNDWIVRIISVGGGSGRRPNNKIGTVGRGRALSDGFENAEEGIELDSFGGRATRSGIGRRKVD